MTEFWELSFRNNQSMWGFEPTDCAESTSNFFQEKGLKEILIPGYGYGRNAPPFASKGMKVTGIEISKTAIEIAKKQFGTNITVHHGDVRFMPFDNKSYDGIFCYALIHLLDEAARKKLLSDCYKQLSPNGYMVFVAVSKNTPSYIEAEKQGKDKLQLKYGLQLFYYDKKIVENEFGHYGLIDAIEIEEPAHNPTNKPSLKFWWILCKKEKK